MVNSEQSENDLFYKIGLICSEHKYNRNNFLPATLHCLTNIKFLTNFFMNYKETFSDDQENIVEKLKKYKDLLDKLKEKKDNKFIKIEDFKKVLNYEEESRENCNPKILLAKMIREFNNYFIKKNNTTILDKISISFAQAFKCIECKNYNEEDNKPDIKFLEYNIIDLCHKKGEINIYDCLNSYTKSEEKKKYCNVCKKDTIHEIKTIYRSLPEVLIIFVEYGNNREFNSMNKIKFNEDLDFEDEENFPNNLRSKKYYLASLICVREIMNTKKEHFYTFCRESEDSKYYCYNGEKVHEVLNIKNKVDKDRINLSDRKQRFPYILVYNSY